MMEAKLLILLFKILICTLLISFKSEGQSVDGPQEVKVFDNYMDNAKLIDNMDDGQEMQRQLEELEKILENPPNPQFQQLDDLSADQEMQRQLEELEKILENPPNPQFQQLDDLSADIKKFQDMESLVDDTIKMKEELSQITFKPFEFKVSAYSPGMLRFKVSDIPNLILAMVIYVAAVFVLVFIIIVIVRCVKKKKTTPSPSNNRLLLWLTFKNTDSGQEAPSGDGLGFQESSGNSSISQESSADRFRLINV